MQTVNNSYQSDPYAVIKLIDYWENILQSSLILASVNGVSEASITDQDSIMSSMDETHDEIIRESVVSLTRCNIISTLHHYIFSSQFSVASIIISRNRKSVLTSLRQQNYYLSLSEIIRQIRAAENSSCQLSFYSKMAELVQFLKNDLIPLFLNNFGNRLHDSDTYATYDHYSQSGEIASLCYELYSFVFANSKVDGSSPLTCLQAIQYVLKLLSTINADNIRLLSHETNVNSSTIDLVEKVKEFEYKLLIQNEMCVHWKDLVTIQEVNDLGLHGLIKNRLETIDELELSNDIARVIRPSITRLLSNTSVQEYINNDSSHVPFESQLDYILYEWIQEVVNCRIVDSGDSMSTSDMIEDTNRCSLTRLGIVALAVQNETYLARSIIKLIQLATESSHDVELNSHQIREKKDTLVKGLIARAETICVLSNTIDKKVQESLREIIRLYHVRILASNYGISNLDPCNPKHLRLAVNVISSRFDVPTSLKDSLELIRAWNIRGVCITGILTRAIIHRFTNTNRLLDDASILHAALDYIPVINLTCVVESVCSSGIELVEQMFFDIQVKFLILDSSNKSFNKIKSESNVHNEHGEFANSFTSIVNGLIYTLNYYHDKCRQIKLKPSLYATFGLLLQLRKLKILQQDHGIHMPISSLSHSKIPQSLVMELSRFQMYQLTVLLMSTDNAVTMYKKDSNADPSTFIICSVDMIKICSLLSITSPYFLFCCMKIAVDSNKQVSVCVI